MEYKFCIRNHWWFDAGIVGLYYIGQKILNDKEHEDIKLSFDSDCLTIKGSEEDSVRQFLEDSYKKLASLYWNVSTKSQKQNMELVLYDEETKEFFLAPRRQATPVVSNFIKGTSWKAESIEYEKMDEQLKVEVDKYLKDTGKSLWGNKKRLLYSPPECHPIIKILPKENIKKQTTCSVCGKRSSHLSDISQPSFLLFASKSAAQSFHSQGRKTARICWECEFLSKFTMDTINYKKDGPNLSILLLNSPNLKHNIDNQKKIGSSSVLRDIDEDYFYKNIGFDEDGLINRARLSYELLWAYFNDSFIALKSNINQNEEDFLSQIFMEVTSAPIEIIIILIQEKGQTFITKELIFYNDISYAFRLIYHLKENGINLRSFYNSLYETDNKGNLMPTRNNVLKRILSKHCIIKDVESITMRKVFANKQMNVGNMIEFLKEYYLIIKEDIMNREQIEVAVNLGKQIVYQPYINSGQDRDVLKKIKGDLFALRKSRTVTDFISQLNTLQFRYGISVSKSILEGMLTQVPFEDFKGYCIMGALNNYNYYNSPRKEKEEIKDE